MSEVVSKKTVDEIIEEINQIDITEIELDAKALEFLKTLEAYIHCFDELEALYEEIDPTHQLANYVMPDTNEAIQQVSKTGEPVKNLAELYEAAEIISPVFVAKINGLKEQLASRSPEESSGVEFKVAPLKGMVRASEKAQDNYSKKDPGPAESWLYDIVRGSLLFDKAGLLFKFLELLRADESIVIVKFKNRFCNPTLSGYRDFNMQIEITNEEDGSKHICELQLHIRAIKEADTRLGSHAFYEFFRKYFAGATGSLKERMNDLRAICQGGSLDMAFLSNVVENPLDLDRMTRLADLFEDYMNEYPLAIVITNAAKDIMEPQNWYNRMGNLFWRQGKLEEALALHQTSLDIRLETLGQEHTDVAISYIDMANVLQNQGELVQAMKLYKKALAIRINALGPEHADVAMCYNNMACVLDDQGEWEEAMKSHKKSLDISLNALGPEHAKVAGCYFNMANVLQNQGDFEEAMKLYNKSLAIRVNALGTEHTLVAMCYNNMALVQFNQGKLEEAMKLYKKALDIYLNALGTEHTLVAMCYINMALVQQNQGELEEAMKLYNKSLDIRLNALGPEHTKVADCHNNMANVKQNQGKLEEAMKLYKKSLAIYLNALGPEHTAVADCYNNMANVLADQGELEEAMKLFIKSLDIRLNALGPNHTLVAMTYNNIGYTLGLQDRFEEGLENCQKALDIQVKTLGENHSDTALTLHSIGEILCKQGKLEEALQYGEKALKVFLEVHGPDHPYTAEGRKLMDMIHHKESRI